MLRKKGERWSVQRSQTWLRLPTLVVLLNLASVNLVPIWGFKASGASTILLLAIVLHSHLNYHQNQRREHLAMLAVFNYHIAPIFVAQNFCEIAKNHMSVNFVIKISWSLHFSWLPPHRQFTLSLRPQFLYMALGLVSVERNESK